MPGVGSAVLFCGVFRFKLNEKNHALPCVLSSNLNATQHSTRGILQLEDLLTLDWHEWCNGGKRTKKNEVKEREVRNEPCE